MSCQAAAHCLCPRQAVTRSHSSTAHRPAALGYVYASHVSFTDNAGGAGPFDYTPNPDAQGFDPLITGFEIVPAGSMAGDSGTGPTSFNVVFRVRIE